MTVKKLTTTPIQESPLDFPELKNMEVTVFEVICEYPVTSPEIAEDIKCMGVEEAQFRVRGSNEPSEQEQILANDEPSGEALLDEIDLDKNVGKVKVKDYFGDDFNKSFLKELSKTAKQQKKDNGQGEYKLPKNKQDKEGAKSAVGS